LEPPDWMNYFWLQFGYFGVFLISIIGAASIIIPVPYTLLIFWLGIWGYNPLLLTIAGGTGSAIGEFSGYLLGYYGRTLLSGERQRKMNYLLKMFGRYGPVAIFLFALTPLPDDLLFIPLGILRYSYVKAFIPSLLGKLLMCYILAYLGQTGGQFILLLFSQEESWIGMIITAVLLAIVVIALYRMDWEKVFEKYMKRKGEGKG